MAIESFGGDTPAQVARVRMHRQRRCSICGVVLRRGAPAHLVAIGAEKRRVVCLACSSGDAPATQSEVPSEATFAVMSALAVPPLSSPPRGSVAVWLAVGVLGVGALLASRTGRRLLTTTGVALKAAGMGLGQRIRGGENVGPAVVRRAFEDLGPTYVKLGQLVASSEGLFPEPYCQEFRKCLDQVRPFPYDDVQRILRAELGRDPRDVFAFIDPKPLASASIAQVHAARLRDGQEVVIKVQRPKIAEIVEADLRVLRLGARAMAYHPRAKLANPVGVVDDFQATIRAELDFRLEAANMAEFNRIMASQGQLRVAAPRVVAEFSTARILVMERFFGHRVDDVEELRPSKVDAEERLLVGMRAWFQCMILHGFFHGDVHAGNLMALDDGRVGFLDFGIVGRFTPDRREQVTDYLVAFATGDFAKLARVMVAMGSVDRGRIDIDKLARDLAEAYEPILSNELTPAKYAHIIPTIMRTGVKHGMRMPRDFVLVVKQMLYFDRYAKLLAPGLNVFRDARVVAGLMEDMMQARRGVETESPTAATGSAFGVAGFGSAIHCR
jgi:aarF domain-containing kinase